MSTFFRSKRNANSPSTELKYERPASTLLQCCLFMSICAFLIAACAYLTMVLLWPSPKLHVVSLVVAPFYTVPCPNSTTNMFSTWDVGFAFQNPATSHDTSYNYLSVFISYDGVVLSNQTVEEFEQTTRRKEFRQVTLSSSALLENRVISDLAEDIEDLEMEFDLHVRGRVALNYGSWRQRSKSVHFHCKHLKVKFLPEIWNGSMTSTVKACHNSMLFY